MEDQIVLHWSHQKEPQQVKSEDEVIRRTWIGLGFQLLLLYPQTHPGTVQTSEPHSKSNQKEPRFKV